MSFKCIICTYKLEGNKRESNVYSTRCGHIFHFHCITGWMRQSMECPTCRTRINQIEDLIKLFLDVGDDDFENATTILHNLTVAQTVSQDKLNEIAKMVESVTINMTKYDDKNQELINENVDLKDHMKAIQSEIEECNKKLEEFEETRDNLSIEKSRVKELERDNGLLEEEIMNKNQTIRELQNELTNLRRNFSETANQKDLLVAVQQRDQLIQNLKEEVNILKTNFSNLQEENIQMQSSIMDVHPKTKTITINFDD